MTPIDDLKEHQAPVWTKFANGDVVKCISFYDHKKKLWVFIDIEDMAKNGMVLEHPELFTFYATEEECVQSTEPFYTEIQVNMIVPAKMSKEHLEQFLMKHPLAHQMTIIIKDEKEIYGQED